LVSCPAGTLGLAGGRQSATVQGALQMAGAWRSPEPVDSIRLLFYIENCIPNSEQEGAPRACQQICIQNHRYHRTALP
jgi:hypothetical protein